MALTMKVDSLLLDPLTNTPIVLLRSLEDERTTLPIWIGPFEAQSIAIPCEGIEPPRPLTHDLLLQVIRQLGATLEKVMISDLRDNTFIAVLHLRCNEVPLTIDSRPSDAIALAVRSTAPIQVEPRVLQKSRDAARDNDSAEQRLRSWFENLDPDGFSKYPM